MTFGRPSLPHGLRWQWCRLEDLAPQQMYAVFAAREAVFVVEQACAYQELDGLDGNAHHLIGWADAAATTAAVTITSATAVAAYLRVIEPGVRFNEPSLGRVLTTAAFRRHGLGRALMQTALDHIAREYPGRDVKISAQVYLDAFYRSFGFAPCSVHYLEDGIPHVDMRRAAACAIARNPR